MAGRVPKPRWNAGRGRWQANIGEPGKDGRAKEVTFPGSIRECDGDKAWEWMKARLNTQEPQKVDPAGLTVYQISQLYLQYAESLLNADQLTEPHYTNKVLHLRHFNADHGRRVAKTLDPESVNRTMRRLAAANYSPSYLANIASTVSACFNWAAGVGKLLASSPIKGFTSPMVPKAAERYADRAEAAAFLGLWRNRLDRTTPAGKFGRITLLMVRVMIRSGSRPGELCKLWWKDIKWDGWTTRGGHTAARAVIPADRWKSGKKTGRPRTVYLTPILTRAIRRFHGDPDLHTRNVFCHGRGRGGLGQGQPWASGSRLSATIRRVRRQAMADIATLKRRRDEPGPWRPLSKTEQARAKVTIQDEGDNRLTNYRWRHTAASTLLMMGVDISTVAELLGTSPEMLHRHYSHILSTHLASAADKLGSPRRPMP